MDSLHLHLIANHIPIIGIACGLFVLIAGVLTQHTVTRKVAMILLILSGIGGFVADKSGEEAEEKVEHLEGFNHDLIHEHEESAEKAMPFIMLTIVLSGVGLFAESKQKTWSKYVLYALLAVSTAATTLSGYAGFVGGKIRHSELNRQLPSVSEDEEEENH